MSDTFADDQSETFFAPPSLEGARLALKALLVEGKPSVDASKHCAVAIDVFDEEGILIQRALAHPAVPLEIRDAFRELVDRSITRFADAQDLDMTRTSPGGPYRGGFVDSNELVGFDCGYALAVARARVAKLRDGLKSADRLRVRLFGVPFLLVTITRRETERAVVLRKNDGSYVFELVARETE
jgi:hypothetical protein